MESLINHSYEVDSRSFDSSIFSSRSHPMPSTTTPHQSTEAYAQTASPNAPDRTAACWRSRSRYPVTTFHISTSALISSPPPPPSLLDNLKGKKTYRLKPLLNLHVQRTTLKGNDLGRGLGLVGNGGAALGAEPAVDGVA